MTEGLDPFPQDLAGKIAYAEGLKTDGNAFVRQRLFKKALRKYKSIYLYITGIDSNLQDIMSQQAASNPDYFKTRKQTPEQAHVESLKIAGWLNIALCYNKLGNGRRARNYANKVLAIEKEHPKALYRRGMGFMIEGMVDEAKEDFESVLKLKPDDAGIKRAFVQLQRRRKEVLAQERKLYGGMSFK